jgi:hypothetical protein
MATNFQSAVTLVLMIFFSKFLLHFACVENGKKLWKKFFHFGSRWRHLPKGLVNNCFSAITLEVSNYFSICFYLPHMEYEGSIGLVSRKMKKFFR